MLIMMYLVGKNNRNFENHENTMEDLKTFFRNTMFLWAATLDFNGQSFQDFLVSFYAPNKGFNHVHPKYLI